MILKSLSLVNYKNFESKSLTFNDTINCLVGNNGIGKTNILDAIYHLSFGKSYFNPIASQNIKHDEDFFVVSGNYNKENKPEKIVVSLKRGQKKVIKRNGKAYNKFSDHIIVVNGYFHVGFYAIIYSNSRSLGKSIRSNFSNVR